MSQAERQKGVRQSLLDAPSQNVPRALVRPVSAFSPPHLSKYFSNFPFVSLSLSLSLPPSFYITPLLRVINYSIIGDRKRSTYPVGLANKSGGEIFDYFLGFCKQNSYCIAGSRALARVSMKILTRNKFDENYKSCDKRRKVKFERGIFFEKSEEAEREREREEISKAWSRIVLLCQQQPRSQPMFHGDRSIRGLKRYLNIYFLASPRFSSYLFNRYRRKCGLRESLV